MTAPQGGNWLPAGISGVFAKGRDGSARPGCLRERALKAPLNPFRIPFERLLNGFTGERLLPPRAPQPRISRRIHTPKRPEKSRLGYPARWDRECLMPAVSGQWGRDGPGPRVSTPCATAAVQDIPIAALDGIEGFPQATRGGLPPETQFQTPQTCIGHLPRHSMSFASDKDRNAVDAEVEGRDLVAKYPAANWQRAWSRGSRSSTTHPRDAKRIHTHDRDRGADLEAPPGGSDPGTLSEGRGNRILIYPAQTATSREWTRAVQQ